MKSAEKLTCPMARHYSMWQSWRMRSLFQSCLKFQNFNSCQVLGNALEGMAVEEAASSSDSQVELIVILKSNLFRSRARAS